MNEYEYTSYSVQWGAVHALHRNLWHADKKTQAAETSAADDSAGTDGAGETASAESSGLPGREVKPDETASAETSAPAEASKTSATAAFIKFAMFGDNMIKYTKGRRFLYRCLRQNDLDPEL